jgi:hypothetical protein
MNRLHDIMTLEVVLFRRDCSPYVKKVGLCQMVQQWPDAVVRVAYGNIKEPMGGGERN